MTQMPFDDRLSRLRSKHRRLAHGVSYDIGPDGLMVPVPRLRIVRRLRVRPLLMLLVLLYGFKVLLYAGLGESAYSARLESLAAGGEAGRAVLPLLGPDPLMRAVGEAAARLDVPWLRRS